VCAGAGCGGHGESQRSKQQLPRGPMGSLNFTALELEYAKYGCSLIFNLGIVAILLAE
jgi:hypothetical protein